MTANTFHALATLILVFLVMAQNRTITRHDEEIADLQKYIFWLQQKNGDVKMREDNNDT